ncbi:hypothetical protein [Rhodobacter calidifons]|uniref:Uncharacterized protein n=1 Tax=Rhodobacter calidifons TaxID=2715277 RepID=A0ABX0G7X4_9RHOB|nr:hypothetical protein [Rhodobacter calidifons]NHB76816.1 hypothetical protein [Rhodobacter calidifons]
MAMGAGLGGTGLSGLLTAALPLIGIVSLLHSRRQRRNGHPPVPDEAYERRRAATLESERRMAAYLAQSRSGGYEALEDDAQEIRR